MIRTAPPLYAWVSIKYEVSCAVDTAPTTAAGHHQKGRRRALSFLTLTTRSHAAQRPKFRHIRTAPLRQLHTSRRPPHPAAAPPRRKPQCSQTCRRPCWVGYLVSHLLEELNRTMLGNLLTEKKRNRYRGMTVSSTTT